MKWFLFDYNLIFKTILINWCTMLVVQRCSLSTPSREITFTCLCYYLYVLFPLHLCNLIVILNVLYCNTGRGSCGLYFKWPFSIRDKESNWEFVRTAGHLRSTIEIPQATGRLYSTPTTAEAALDCERLRKHICWWLKCGVLRWPLDHNVIVKALRVGYLSTTRALSIKLRSLLCQTRVAIKC